MVDKQRYGGKEDFRERVRKPKVSEKVLGKQSSLVYVVTSRPAKVTLIRPISKKGEGERKLYPSDFLI